MDCGRLFHAHAPVEKKLFFTHSKLSPCRSRSLLHVLYFKDDVA